MANILPLRTGCKDSCFLCDVDAQAIDLHCSRVNFHCAQLFPILVQCPLALNFRPCVFAQICRGCTH
eukprot:10987840-Prorocentrum_lima.AAC.1